MRKIVFDIETTNFFHDVGKNDPSLLDLAVIGIYDFSEDKYSTFEQNELPSLWQILGKTDLLVGFNSDHFDIPLLNKYCPNDITKIKSLDLLKEVRNSCGKRIGLGHLAESTLGVGKSSDGIQAVEWWRKGEKEKVKEYCIQDVKVTKELYEYALKNKCVLSREGQKVVTIPLETSKWSEINEFSFTQSLPF